MGEIRKIKQNKDFEAENMKKSKNLQAYTNN